MGNGGGCVFLHPWDGFAIRGDTFFVPVPSCWKINDDFLNFVFKQSVGGLHYAAFREGVMAEWLGTGLQNLLQRFNSASRLQILERVV